MVAAKGFHDNWNGQGVNYISDRLALEDMHPANVFIDKITDSPICIDCIVKFVTAPSLPADIKGIVDEYRNME